MEILIASPIALVFIGMIWGGIRAIIKEKSDLMILGAMIGVLGCISILVSIVLELLNHPKSNLFAEIGGIGIIAWIVLYALKGVVNIFRPDLEQDDEKMR